MSLIDDLESSVESEDVQGNLLLIEYSPDSKELWLLVEGKNDLGLFGKFARTIFPEDWKIKARRPGRKSAVLRLCKEHHRRYPDATTALFFVDRDHSKYVPDEGLINNLKNLYITDGYSVENWMVSTQCLTASFSQLLGLPQDSETVSKLVTRTSDAVSSLAESIRPIMAWAIEMRRLGKKAHFDNLKLGDFVTLDLDNAPCCCPRYQSLQSLVASLGTTSCAEVSPIPANVSSLDTRLQDEPRDYWLRGKALGWLVSRVVEYVQKNGSGDLKISVNVGPNNFVQLFSPHLEMPASLRDFLVARRPV